MVLATRWRVAGCAVSAADTFNSKSSKLAPIIPRSTYLKNRNLERGGVGRAADNGGKSATDAEIPMMPGAHPQIPVGAAREESRC